MSIAALQTAILTRATGDTGAGGLFLVSDPLINYFGFYNLPAAQTMPFVVATWAAVPSEHGFTVDVFRPELRLRAFVAKAGAPAATPMQRLSDICERLLTRFHRWQPTLSGSSWTCNDGLLCVDENPEPDDLTYTTVLTFRCTISKSA